MSESDINALTFEQAMEQLETLVKKLEEGKFSLDEAVKYYEKGVELKNFCDKKLQAAKMKVEKLTVNGNGEVASEQFGA